MIESIEFTNFKALRKTTLPLAPFTLLLGPNGSGKTTVLQSLEWMAFWAARYLSIDPRPRAHGDAPQPSLLSVTSEDREASLETKLWVRLRGSVTVVALRWGHRGDPSWRFTDQSESAVQQPQDHVLEWLARMQTFSLDPIAIGRPVPVDSGPVLPSGAGLPAVLDDLKDNYPERWAALLDEMQRWLPEYDHIVFDKPNPGSKGVGLRTRKGGHRIAASALSQGTLVALAMLTLAYLPDPPTLIGLEEIDRGLHPRLLRHLQDALYRLSYPESCGETRPPIQVIATSHSPYLLDLYREHPEQVVLAQKEGLEVEMRRLTDIQHFEEILGDSPLSEVWYSGVLGGVSVKP